MTAAPATVEVLVAAGKVDVMVASRVDVIVLAASVEIEVTVTGSSKGGKAHPTS